MRENNRDDARVRQQASQASALMAERARAKKAAGATSAAPSPQDAPEEPKREYPKGIAGFSRQNLKYIIAVAVVALVVAIGVVVLGAVTPHTAATPSESTPEPPAYVSPYDWGKLDRTDGRYRYVVDGEVKSRLGVDVSENQHDIDWNAVAADGIDFAMIRVGYRGATQGDLYLDEYYWANLDGARNAGLDVGLYFFSQARTAEEAVEEADFVLDYLGGTPLEYPIAFDSETSVLGVEAPRTAGLNSDEMTAIAEAFCQRIESAGYASMVYGNVIDLSRYHTDNLGARPLWWAEYGVPIPNQIIDIDYWQYSNSGQVAGIPTAVDMNIDLTRALD